MSKIGRKSIDISGITVDIKGQQISYKGPKASGSYTLPNSLVAQVSGGRLKIVPAGKESLKQRILNREWGMHRALLYNALVGSKREFEKIVEIVGLGYKGVAAGNKLTFTLGYSHKVDFEVPKGVSVSIDKTGQRITVSSADRELLGLVCSKMCELRRPEPYKGTGVKLSTETVIRKAAKGK